MPQSSASSVSDGMPEGGWSLANWAKTGGRGDESHNQLLPIPSGMSLPASAPGSVVQSPSRRGINLLDEVVC